MSNFDGAGSRDASLSARVCPLYSLPDIATSVYFANVYSYGSASYYVNHAGSCGVRPLYSLQDIATPARFTIVLTEGYASNDVASIIRGVRYVFITYHKKY